MKTTLTLSANLNCSPFEIFAQDCDDVIMLINYFLLSAKNDTNDQNNDYKRDLKPKRTKFGSNERIRVNDKTATGGWF